MLGSALDEGYAEVCLVEVAAQGCRKRDGEGETCVVGTRVLRNVVLSVSCVTLTLTLARRDRRTAGKKLEGVLYAVLSLNPACNQRDG